MAGSPVCSCSNTAAGGSPADLEHPLGAHPQTGCGAVGMCLPAVCAGHQGPASDRNLKDKV
jgi:hypothetical protein